MPSFLDFYAAPVCGSRKNKTQNPFLSLINDQSKNQTEALNLPIDWDGYFKFFLFVFLRYGYKAQ